MKITVNVQGHDYTLDFAEIDETTVNPSTVYVLEYGMKKSIADAAAGKGPGSESAVRLSRKRWEALRAGNPPTVGTKGDAVVVEMRAVIKANAAKARRRFKAIDVDACKDRKSLTEFADVHFQPGAGKNVLDAAEATVASRRDTVDLFAAVEEEIGDEE